ncbi:MAG TPA: hypothetical protein VJW96_07680 [Terriglobales bacterium]|nr:hypothetical protein [Terriglobales bacterium]
MKPTHFLLVSLLIMSMLIPAALCAAQTAPKPATADANQPVQPPATGAGQTPEQTPPPAKPPAGQPAQPADQSQGQSQAKDSQSSKDAKTDEAGTSATSKDRLFFALPNFLTLENAGQVPPLTAGQKFKVVAQGSFDPIQIVWYGALSGISQAENSEPGFGQGWEAYGKRYGAYAADGTIENFFVGAILPSVLHQDPRYFQSGHGSFFNRTEYAVSRIFVTRTDSGHHQFNFSEIIGSALAAGISTYSYHPHPGYHPEPGVNVPYIASDRTLKNTASVWGSQVGYDTITLVIKEFWPDIRRKIKKQPH